MTVTVRFFASLREETGIEARDVEADSSQTIGDIWNRVADRPVPVNLLCALNHEYAEMDQKVEDGDEVAFFPPVNGG
jgi:molybdopterin synthase sulfur carrier subunit